MLWNRFVFFIEPCHSCSWHGPIAKQLKEVHHLLGPPQTLPAPQALVRAEGQKQPMMTMTPIPMLLDLAMARQRRYESWNGVLQTEKARTQMQLNAQKRRQQKLAESDFPQHAADSYQADLTPETTLTNPGNYSKTQKLRRLRLLFSWFTSWITSVIGCFFPGKHKIRHVINICVVDDTNMRLAAPYKVTGKSRQSRIVSVINNLQTLVFNISPADEDLQPVLEAESSNAGSQTDICNRASYRSFTVHTPMVPLDASTNQCT